MKILYCSLIALLSLPSIHGTNYYEIFLQGNETYKKGNYQDALKLYEAVPNPSPHVNYNLGNTHYKLGNYGKALLHWRRAERNWGLFNKRELLGNILLLQKKLFPDAKPSWKDSKPIAYAWSTLESISIRNLQILFLCVCFLVGILVHMHWLRFRRSLLNLFAPMLLVVGSIIIFNYLAKYHYRVGVVIAKVATTYSGPSTTYTPLGTLSQAQEVRIEKESGDYFKIHGHGKTSWIEKTNISEI